MLSTFLFSMRIPELNSLVINLATDMAQNLEGTALSGRDGVREDLRSKRSRTAKMEFKNWPTGTNAAQHSTGEMPPEAIDNFSAKRF